MLRITPSIRFRGRSALSRRVNVRATLACRRPKIAAYRTYVVGALIEGPAPRALLWDDAHPYHYIRSHRLQGGGQVLIVGGEDHKVGQAEDTRVPDE